LFSQNLGQAGNATLESAESCTARANCGCAGWITWTSWPRHNRASTPACGPRITAAREFSQSAINRSMCVTALAASADNS
jgi:hypothetical protein